MIGIIDYDIGNIGSLMNAFSYLAASTEVVSDPTKLDSYDKIVLPGVGAFDTAMSALESSGLNKKITAFVNTGRPLLGICLGMQILCESSDEGKKHGLGLVKGRVENLRNLGCSGKTPHIGFNSIDHLEGNSLFLLPIQSKDFYFVHSFALHYTESNGGFAYTEHMGAKFIAAMQVQNIFATQFHPEKSGSVGLDLLKRFISC